jgi:hypothetical protein
LIYRGNCFWGSGVNAVLNVNGLLILADQRKKLSPDIDLTDLTLRLSAEPDALVGNIALVNNHLQAGDSARFWFGDWTIRGRSCRRNGFLASGIHYGRKSFVSGTSSAVHRQRPIIRLV